jgi:hypothetical protein
MRWPSSVYCFLITLFLVFLTAAVTAALIAHERGRSWLGFGLVTFFLFGPLGPGFALLATRGGGGAAAVHMPALRRG